MSWTVEESTEAMPKARRNRETKLPEAVIASINNMMDPEHATETVRVPGGNGKKGTDAYEKDVRKRASAVTHYIKSHWTERVDTDTSPEKVTTQYLRDAGVIVVGLMPRDERTDDVQSDEEKAQAEADAETAEAEAA